MENVSKELLIFSAAVDNYNCSHRKFGLKFITHEEQELFVTLIQHRMNKLNPLENTDIGKQNSWP